MNEILKNCDGRVHYQDGPDGKNTILVYPDGNSTATPTETWDTSYPIELVQFILDIAGPETLIKNIRRDEDPSFVQVCLEKDILAYVPENDLKGKRMLDFGCGSGASTMILARLFPDTEIVGVDLNENALEIARARGEYYGFEQVSFLSSPAADKLPDRIGTFDYIMFSAVFEHLLPNERTELLPRIWNLLNDDGVLFLDQTPWKFFPFEGHTTRLPFINYLPAMIALPYARTFSNRIAKDTTWKSLLRRGVRGGSAREIMKILNNCQDSSCRLLKPCRSGINNRVDLWQTGYAVSIAGEHPRFKNIQSILYLLAKGLYMVTRLEIVPSLSLAIRKNSKP